MKIRVKTQCNDLVMDIKDSDSNVIYTLMNANCVNGYGDPVILTDNKGIPIRPGIEIIQDVLPADPIIDKLTEAVKIADSRWLEYYERAVKAERKIEELNEKISMLTSDISEN